MWEPKFGLLNDKMSISSPKHLIFDILSVVGGVPRYLEEIRPSLTVDENMRRMCFLKQGLLFREFDETFNAVFGSDAVKRRAVLEALSGGSMKASRRFCESASCITAPSVRKKRRLRFLLNNKW